MHIAKYFWAFRALVYKLRFRHIGNMSYIGKPLYMEGIKRVSIGARTRIFPGMRIEAIKDGEIEIGDNVVIEQNAHIISMGSILKIKNDVTIAPNVFISNVNHEYRDIEKSVMDQDYIEQKTEIGQSCFIGYGAVILPGTKLGKHCIVGANAVVRGEYPDYCVLVGNPAKIIKEYNAKTNTWERYYVENE